jgi:electron transfer flavoprotein alpha subunit
MNVPRRDPRAGRPRSRAQSTACSGPQRRRVAIAAPACWVLAVPDRPDGRLSGHDHDALGAARRLADAGGGAVIALVSTPDGELAAAGADRVMCFDDTCNELRGPARAADCVYAPERRAACVLAAVRALNPRHVVLPDTPHAGGDVGRRVAAALGEMPATNVVSFEGEREQRVGSRTDGGKQELLRVPPRVVLIAPEAAEPVTETMHEAAPMAAPAFEPEPPRLADLGLMPLDPGAVPLAEAELIVSAGAGVEDWETFHALAAALGASEGGSRVVCDAGALPRGRQIGASGTLVSARGYLALGISGAPQHLQGIAGCECVIAVNTDPHAEIVKRADLVVIADVQQIMPELTSELRSTRNRGAAGRNRGAAGRNRGAAGRNRGAAGRNRGA